MTTLFDIKHESDLSEYDSTVTDSGDLSQGSPGLAGTAGRMEALIDDTNNIYGVKNIGTALGQIRLRFYMDINSLTMANNNAFSMIYVPGSGGTILYVTLRFLTASQYWLRIELNDDNGAWQLSSYYAITDAEHYIEVHVVRATNAASNDGTAQFWIDGASQELMAGLDIFDRFANVASAQMGARASLDAGTSGTLLLDEFTLNDDGSEIGAVPTGALPMAMHHYQTRRL